MPFRSVALLSGAKLRALLLVFSGLFLAGCASLTPQDFARSGTHFELDRYFIGHNRSWGVFETPHGRPKRYFIADSYGKRDARGAVTLTQHFRFSDGRTQLRIWHIRRLDATHWVGTANDMIGVARGEAVGNALYWEYTITVNPRNPMASVHVRQWIYQPEGTDELMTRLVITKLGMTLFEVSESIRHLPDR